MFNVVSFFFSSRRRHTRSLCDWSSDVCSSDLGPAGRLRAGLRRRDRRGVVRDPRRRDPTRTDPHRPGRGAGMSEPVVWLTIFVLSVFVGIEVISKVSSTLHTPLMSGANAIHGIILLGAIIVTGTTDSNAALVVGLVAIVLAAVNMVGGFVVTDRMLQMFVRKKKPAVPAGSDGKAGG